MAHRAKGQKLLAIRCAESHESAIDRRKEAKPHHARNRTHREREYREHPDDKAKHARLAHCTREDSRERSRGFGVGNRLPAMERENRSLHEERQEEANEKHILRTFREALESNRQRDKHGVVRNREEVPQGNHHRSRTDQRINRKRHRRLHPVLATETGNQNGSRNHHGFKEEEEQHGVGSEEGAVHGAHQREDANREVAIAPGSNAASRNQSHKRQAARKEHHPRGKSMAIQVIVNRSLASGDVEPFDGIRCNVSADKESDRHRRKDCSHQNGQAGRRLRIILRRHHHKNGGNERGEDKEM